MESYSFSLVSVLFLNGVFHFVLKGLLLIVFLHRVKIFFPFHHFNLLELVLNLLVFEGLLEFLFHFRMFHSPLLDLMNLAEFLLSSL